MNTNLTDTDIQQPFASAEYLDEDDETKDVRAWAKAGLNYTEMLPFMPLPPSSRMPDVLNPSFLDMVISSFNDGIRDPCNSEYKTDDLDKLCEAILSNDLTSIMESFEYPVVVCHSPDDELGKKS